MPAIHQHRPTTRLSRIVLIASLLLLILSACSGNAPTKSTSMRATQQTLVFPDVGVSDLSTLDPALGSDQTSTVILHMLYSGLVQTTQDGQVVPDQATWQISPDQTSYTFSLRSGITFPDGTPITAETYIYTWTRALSPTLASPLADTLEHPITGADAVAQGHAQTISGLKALNPLQLQVTLTQPDSSFLAALTNPLFFALNPHVITRYGQQNWSQHAVGAPLGTGPFVVSAWQHNSQMTLQPNPRYYAQKTRLRSVEVQFVPDPVTAYYSYSAGLYDIIWGLDPNDQQAITGSTGAQSVPRWQTNALFFNLTQAPFNTLAVRQAFAQSINKTTLTHLVLNNASIPASTLLPPGLPGYEASYHGLAFDAAEARKLLHAAYPNSAHMPAVTFTYPISQVSQDEAMALQTMWQTALGIQVALHPLEPAAYAQELSHHQIQLGFTACVPDYPDVAPCLTSLVSTSRQNAGQWHNAGFDQLLTQASTATEATRLALYDQAEQLALSDVSEFPLDHPVFSAVIPPWLHGVTVNGSGFFFGNWSDVYVLTH